MNIEVRYKIRTIRMKRGITLRQLERISSVSKSELSNIERNNADPTLKTLLMIAFALQVNLNELFEILVK